MTAVVQQLRETMPSYMNQQILDFVCEDKETAIIDECVDYIRRHRFKDPKVKTLMSSLLSEVDQGLYEQFPAFFKKLLVSEPMRQIVRIIRSSDLGLLVFLRSTFRDGYTVICRRMHKRSTRLSITVLKDDERVYLLQDAPCTVIGTTRCTNRYLIFLHRIFRAHLPHEVETILLDLMKNNTWESTTNFITKLYSLQIQRKHRAVTFNVKVAKRLLEPAVTGDCRMTIRHTV